MYAIANSRKNKGKVLKEHILKDIVPCGFDARIAEIKEEHHQQTTQLQLAITDRDNQIRAIQYENVTLQAQRNVYQAQLQRCQEQVYDVIINRHVTRANDSGKDKIIMVIEKNTIPEEDEIYEYSYYIARIQRRFINTKRQWLRVQYPHHRFMVEEVHNADCTHAFNRFEEGHAERLQCHFRLVDLARDALYVLGTTIIHDSSFLC